MVLATKQNSDDRLRPVFAWCEEIVIVSAEIPFKSPAGCLFFIISLVICHRILLAAGGI